MSIRQKRIMLVVLILITVLIGLASRKYAQSLPEFIAEYAGDTMYAMCAYFMFRLFFIKRSSIIVVLFSFIFCVIIETLQLYQATWIQDLRNTPPFGLLLGYGFLWSDLIGYVVGSLIAPLVEFTIARLYTPRRLQG